MKNMKKIGKHILTKIRKTQRMNIHSENSEGQGEEDEEEVVEEDE